MKQMGSTMKPTIFNERVAVALKHWHHTAKKHVKENRGPNPTIRPISPRFLLPYHRTETDTVPSSPATCNFDYCPSPHQLEIGHSQTQSHFLPHRWLVPVHYPTPVQSGSGSTSQSLSQPSAPPPHEIDVGVGRIQYYPFDQRPTIQPPE